MTATIDIGPIRAGPGEPLLVIAGPCVLEDPATNERIGTTLRELCAELGLGFVFKASFDKANRSGADSPRGPGLEKGLAELDRLRRVLAVPITTDVHEPSQAQAVGAVADLLQVPAFLCRQTDLLVACAKTGRPVNVKKGQFVSPAEMRHVVDKLNKARAAGTMLTERGTFFGYHRLVNDFIGLGDLMDLGCPVCFDVTHSTQLPGAGASVSGGRPDRASLLARAATSPRIVGSPCRTSGSNRRIAWYWSSIGSSTEIDGRLRSTVWSRKEEPSRAEGSGSTLRLTARCHGHHPLRRKNAANWRWRRRRLRGCR